MNVSWLMWLSWLGLVLQSERTLFQFLVRAHAWVIGSASGQDTCERQPINVSLLHQRFSPSLSPSPVPLK